MNLSTKSTTTSTTKIHYQIKMFLETNMDKLFESRKVPAANAAIPEVDAELFLLEHRLFSTNKYC